MLVIRSRRILAGLASILGAIILATSVQAQVPTQVPFQGLLLDAQGAPVNDAVDLDFELFDALVGGSSLWTESHLGIIVVDGVYSVNLGSSVPLTSMILSGSPTFLEITVGGETLVPRQQMLSVPYALVAENIGGASSLFIQQLTEQYSFDGQEPGNLHPDEGTGDTDGDGQPNFLDADNDNDGVDDGDELALGTPINLVDPTISSTSSSPSPLRSYFPSTLSVVGLSLETVASASLGAEVLSPFDVSPTSFSANVLAETNAASETLTVTLSNGQSTTRNVTITAFPPSIAAFDPPFGAAGQASEVTILGGGFYAGTTVQIGTQNLAATIVSSNEMTVMMAPEPAALVSVVVTHPNTLTASKDYRILGADERIVFVSSAQLAATALSGGPGFSTADGRCQTEADQAGLPGTYRAWRSLSQASPSTFSPATTFPQNVGPYRLPSDAVVANDWADLTDGALQNPISALADGTVISGIHYAWTGTAPDGTALATSADTCNDWTSTSGGDSGWAGGPLDASSQWTQKAVRSCSGLNRLYCFQQ